MYNFHPYNVLLSITTNIAVLLMTASVLQGHILVFLLQNFPFSSMCTRQMICETCQQFLSECYCLKVKSNYIKAMMLNYKIKLQ